MQNGSARSSMQPPQAQRVLCRRTARKTPRPDRNPVGPEVHRARLEGDSSQFRVHGRPGVTALADRRQAAVHTTPQGRSQAAYKTVRRRTSGCNKRGATSAALGNTLTRAPRRKPIMSKILGTAIVAGLLFVVTAPAFAADAPKTKAECQKLTDMKWDAKTKTCVKK